MAIENLGVLSVDLQLKIKEFTDNASKVAGDINSISESMNSVKNVSDNVTSSISAVGKEAGGIVSEVMKMQKSFESFATGGREGDTIVDTLMSVVNVIKQIGVTSVEAGSVAATGFEMIGRSIGIVVNGLSMLTSAVVPVLGAIKSLAGAFIKVAGVILGPVINAFKAFGSFLLKFVTSPIKSLRGSLMGLVREFRTVSYSISNVGRTLSLFISTPIAAFGALSTKAASAANEIAQRFDVVFRGIESSATGALNRLAGEFDLADSTAKDLLSSNSALLKGFGFTQREALNMSEAVIKIAGDLASFKDLTTGTAGAVQAITRGMVGESQALKKLDIALQFDNRTIVKQVKAIMRQRNVTLEQARAILVIRKAYEQSQDALGDYARTATSMANSMRFLSESFKAFREAVGEVLIDVLQLNVGARSLGNQLRSLAKVIRGLPRTWKVLIVAIGAFLAAIGPVLIAIGTLGLALTALLSAAITFGPIFTAAFAIAFPWIMDVYNEIVKIVGKIKELIKEGKSLRGALISVFSDIWENFAPRFLAIIDSIQKAYMFLQLLVPVMGSIFEKINNIINAAIADYKRAFGELFKWFASTLFRTVKDVIQKIGTAVKKVLTTGMKEVAEGTFFALLTDQSVFDVFATRISTAFDKAFGTGKDAGPVGNVFTSFVDMISKTVDEAINKVTELFSIFDKDVNNPWSAMVTKFIEDLKNQTDDIKKKITDTAVVKKEEKKAEFSNMQQNQFASAALKGTVEAYKSEIARKENKSLTIQKDQLGVQKKTLSVLENMSDSMKDQSIVGVSLGGI